MQKVRDRPIPFVLNAGIVLAQLCAVGLCFYILPRTDNGWELLALACVFGVVMNSVYSSIHEAHHRVLFPSEALNDAIGILLSLLFPAAFHLLRQGHIGHHVRNRSDDEVFDLYFDSRDKVWKYIVWYGILTGFYWGLVVISNFALLLAPALLAARNYSWHRTFEAFLESFNPAYLRLMQLEALIALVLHAAIIFLLGVSFWKYLGMYYGFGLMWSSMQYIHHYAAERDVLRGARNLYVNQILDFIWLNHNLHRTHHCNPSVPWNQLPDLAREEGDQADFLLDHYWGMWKGPKQATESVQNRYAGRIIR